MACVYLKSDRIQSCMAITHKEHYSETHSVNLVYFISEGPPHDNGNDLTANQSLIENAAKGHVNTIACYTPRIMKELKLDSYVTDYVEPGLVTMNPGMYRIGNCAWRPKIMLLELEKMNEGDILIYRDSNIRKYSVLGDYEDIKAIAKQCLEICEFDFFIARETDIPIKYHTKTNILRELGEDHPFSYEFRSLVSNFIIVKKSPVSIQLLTEWDNACCVTRWIDPFPYGDMMPGFRWSCPEQSILSVIIANWIRHKKHNIPPTYPKIGFRHRNIKQMFYFDDFGHLTYL